MQHAQLMTEDARAQLQALQTDLGRLVDEVQRVVVGQDAVIRGVVTCLLAAGHGLLEGVPDVWTLHQVMRVP